MTISKIAIDGRDHQEYNEIHILPGDGAIPIPRERRGLYIITHAADAAALTIPVPDGGDDGKILDIVSATAKAHVITQGTTGFNAKNAAGTATFGAAIGNSVSLVAWGGEWYSLAVINVVFA